MSEVLLWLETTALAEGLRQSTWVYPLVNAGHIAGVALLIGAIVPLDLRLLGCWPTVPVDPLARVLRPVAAAGLVLAVAAGSLLFIAGASEYAASPFFLAKMGVVAAGGLNALAVSAVPVAAVLRRRRIRISAVLSILCWLTALVLGRLVGFF